MNQNKIKIGMPVIINYFDRPCTRLVAIVREITDDGFVHAVYLERDVKLQACDRIENVTPLEDFGVKLIIINRFASCRVVGKSQAKYADGRLRQWQDDEDSEFEVRDSAYELWFNFREKN